MTKLIYTGGNAGGIDIPDAGITAWKPGEAREVPDDLAEELLHRTGEFQRVNGPQPPRRERSVES